MEWVNDYEDCQRLESYKYDHILRDEGFERRLVGGSGDGIGDPWVIYTKNIVEVLRKAVMLSTTDNFILQGRHLADDREVHHISISYIQIFDATALVFLPSLSSARRQTHHECRAPISSLLLSLLPRY